MVAAPEVTAAGTAAVRAVLAAVSAEAATAGILAGAGTGAAAGAVAGLTSAGAAGGAGSAACREAASRVRTGSVRTRDDLSFMFVLSDQYFSNEELNNVSFADCILRAQAKEEVCIGIKINSKVTVSAHSFADNIYINPDLGQRFQLTNKDFLIVLSGDE
jgi:hypothetical protein